MKRLFIQMLILPWLLFAVAVHAGQSVLQPQSQGDVSFVSGGVGSDEWDALQSARSDYNLNALFTVQGSGEYLSNVRVNIADAKGNTYLETVAEGPLLLVNLKPGKYTVSAELDGQISRKKVTVSGRKATSLSFAWPQ